MNHTLLFTRREALITLAGVMLTAACGQSRSDQPALINYGRDECAWCRMPVDDPALAAEWIAPGDTPAIFGEPGCLLAWLAAHPGASGSAWVRVQDREQWYRATDAIFEHDRVRTPMSFNLAAFAVATPGTTGMTWSQLLAKGAPDARPS